ncbi:GNAT family N-acetyltransferase [Nocardia sp. NPDC057668]|uniref:GNAT family N-acetyltransferase n=1 Tax=Nocardia sp. NPDC057668 TaxID=3346202 RepID=UPI00366DAD03
MPKTLQDIEIRPAVKSDIAAMTAALDRAFSEDDPFGEYMFPDPAKRARAQPRLTRAMIRHQYLPLGGAHVATVDGVVAGGMLWKPPGYRFGPLRYLASIPEFTWAMGAGGPRVLAVDSAIGKIATGLPHCFGVTLGVDPHRQQSGVGSALLQFAITEIEKAAVPALCLCKDGNVGYYELFGGQRLGRIRLGRSGPQINVMMWLPSSLKSDRV